MLARRLGLLVDHGLHDEPVGPKSKRHLAGQQLVKQDSETVDIGAGTNRAIDDGLFRCHVDGGADHASGARQPCLFQVAGQAEIADLGGVQLDLARGQHPAGAEQHIGRLEVAVDDPLEVGGVDGAGEGATTGRA